MTYLGTYSGATHYITNDVVIYSGTVYIALGSSTGDTPPSASWQIIGSTGA
jgi:hypothetical protein